MSYTSNYSEVVSKTITINYNYPASQNGGSGSESVTVDIPVDVNIHVDTIPFDNSVAGCNTAVNTLTGAVVATETVHIASIDKNAKKIAGTIVEGFFKNIRFEISSQVMELKQKIDAHLMHLRELSKQLVTKKTQMETDYNRTASRYSKIFDDLNNEISIRITELDKPAFQFKRLADNHIERTVDNDLVSTVTIAGAEGGDLHSRIGVSVSKNRALKAIIQANVFLSKQKQMQRNINRSMLTNSTFGQKYSPVCLLETKNENNQISKNIFQCDYLPKMPNNPIIENFQTRTWNFLSNEGQEKIVNFFISEIAAVLSASDPHTLRVKDTIMKIFNFDSIKSI